MWPPDALDFLRELEDNNDRDWFRANRDRYDAHLREPALALAEKLAHLGEPHTFRPYNDTRFHPRPPLKEQFGVAIGYGSAGGFYFELSLDGFLVAAGLHHPSPDQLQRYRAAIDDDRRSARFEQAIATAIGTGLTPAAPALKRAPRGYPATHPRIDPASDDRADRRPPPSARALAAPAGMRSAGPAGARVSQATCGMARRVRRSLTPPAPLSAREMTRVASLRPRPALATSRSGQTGLESAPTRP